MVKDLVGTLVSAITALLLILVFPHALRVAKSGPEGDPLFFICGIFILLASAWIFFRAFYDMLAQKQVLPLWVLITILLIFAYFTFAKMF